MATEFTITKMAERQRLTPGGAVEKYWRIEAQTAKGTPFTVEVADGAMTAKQVQELVKAKAKQLDSILEL
jgi:hypothetical protein